MYCRSFVVVALYDAYNVIAEMLLKRAGHVGHSMNQISDIASELFLVRVSAENNTPHIVVVDQRNQSRTAFSNLQSALSYIEQTLRQLSCQQEQKPSIENQSNLKQK